MLTRREALTSLASLASPGTLASLASVASVASVAMAGCSRETTPTWPRRSKHDGVEFIELFPQGANESSPLVVAIHGLGDKPDQWIEPWQTFPAKVEIALPRGFTRHGEGWSWFDIEGKSDAELGEAVGAAEEKLWKGIAKLAGQRRLIVTGFSQGGILSFAAAARHPDRIAYAFPVSGSLPGPLLPRNKARAAPLVAFHGTADPVLAFQYGKGAVDAFAAEGNQATLRAYNGVPHTITPLMRADLTAEIQKALPLLR